MDMNKKKEIGKAFSISLVCIFSYFVSYYMRNLLSVSTPEMLESGRFTTERVGTLSSVYMLTYAIGQLLNGAVGDRVKPKFMTLIGLSVCGAVCIGFAHTETVFMQIALFAIMGFALSMLRGPLVKTICENISSQYAHIACVFLSFICSAGPLAASIFAIFLDWRMTFIVAGVTSVVFGVISFAVLSVFERQGLISFKFGKKEGGEKKSVLGLFRLEHFFYYMLLGMICEIAGTTISFWLPTYLSSRLGFDTDASGLLFSAIALIKSFSPFAALLVLRLFRGSDIAMSRVTFAAAGILFVGVLLAENKWLNVVLLLLALMAIQLSSTLLWSIYIPNQAKSGLVSTLNGFLDFSGYVAASAANILFSFTMSGIGWDGIVIMWSALAAIGLFCSLFVRKKKNAEL